MKKLNKKQYEAMKQLLNNQLDSVNQILELAAKTDGLIFSDIDQWNEYHDRADEIENEIRDLETTYSRRNWTQADYSTRSLINSNID